MWQRLASKEHKSSYVALLIHRLTFLQVDVNQFFLIGAVIQRDSCSSTSKCEVFGRRYGCQHENVCHCAWIANRTMHRCCHFLRLWSSRVWKIRRHLVSADFKGASKFVSYLKFCLYDARWRDLEIPGWLALNESIINHCSRCFKIQ